MSKKKLATIIIASVLVLALIIGLIIGIHAKNDTFSKSKVSKIEIGMTQDEVKDILGEPCDEGTGGRYWTYYEKKAKKQIEKMSDDFFDSDDFEAAFDSLDEAYGKLEKMKYKSIVVEFGGNDNTVTSIALNKDTKYDEPLFGGNYECHKKKELKDFSISRNTVAIGVNMSEQDIVYTAEFKDGSYRKAIIDKWSGFSTAEEGTFTHKFSDEWADYSVRINIAEANLVVISDEKDVVVKGTGYYEVGDIATLSVSISNSCVYFEGWYDGYSRLSTDMKYEYRVQSKEKTKIRAQFTVKHTTDVNCVCIKCGETYHDLNDECYCRNCKKSLHEYNGGCVCEVCGRANHIFNSYGQCNVCRYGEIVEFGSYPQREVVDGEVVTALTERAGALPTPNGNQKWNSYGYYIDGRVYNFMWYKDIEYAGEKYRGVYFTAYRPFFATSSETESYQKANGYVSGTVYWFLYEPIKWRILTSNSSAAMLMAETVIDSQEYYINTDNRTKDGKTIYANNYAESNIREWLNDTFYNTAFSISQRQAIKVTTVGNDADTSDETKDYIFLASSKDCATPGYGINRSSYLQKESTDYAKSQGAYGGQYHDGRCWWWLRSPAESDVTVNIVSSDGNIRYNSVDTTSGGVVPVMWISKFYLASSQE